MHQTTVRFGPDLWAELAGEAERAGVSVAQYVRDAALMRVSYMRGRERDPHYEAVLEATEGADGSRPGTARSRQASREIAAPWLEGGEEASESAGD